MKSFACTLCLIAVAALAGPGLSAEEPQMAAADSAAGKAAPASESKAEPKPATTEATTATPATHKVKREPFKVEVTLKAAFEAQTLTELSVRPEVWATLEVVNAAEHGAAVRRGDVVVQFDLAKIDEEIADVRAKSAITELAFKQAKENLLVLKATVPLDLKLAERSRQMSREDRDKFFKVDRPLMEKAANFSLEMSKNSLEYEQEELRQLQKMYEADDLTEETEEIILKRQRNTVKSSEFMYERSKQMHHDTMKIELPRRTESIEQSAKRQEIVADRAKITLPLSLTQAERELEKSSLELAKEVARLKKLEADRGLLTVKAPADGVVYYGRFVRGKWSGMETLADTLRRGGNVTKGSVFMTIVEPRPLRLRAGVTEADLAKVQPGLKGEVELTAYPNVRLPVTVERVDNVPSAADSFDVRLTVKLPQDGPAPVPGMNGTVKLLSYRQPKALVVPARAVFSDEIGQKSYVFVTKAGKSRKQPVTVGRKTDDRAEILDGLNEGDEVLLERPKATEKPVDAKNASRAKKPSQTKKPSPAKKPAM